MQHIKYYNIILYDSQTLQMYHQNRRKKQLDICKQMRSSEESIRPSPCSISETPDVKHVQRG